MSLDQTDQTAGTTQTTEQTGDAATQTTQAAAGGDQAAQTATTQQATQASQTTTQSTQATTQTAQATAAWGDNWREQYAGQDEKRLNVLKRFSSPKDALDSLFSFKTKVDSGEIKKPLTKDATPEQIAAWRKDNGIPDNAGDYLVNLPNGLVIGEADKPTLTAFAEMMHKANAPPQYVHAAIAWHNERQQAENAEMAAADAAAKQKTEDELRTEWGGDYKTNVNLVKEVMLRAGDDVAAAISEAVLPDGTVLANHSGALRWLANLAREINPVGTITPAGGAAQGKSIDEEIAMWEGKMSDQASDYWKGPTADKNQERYRQLVDARSRTQARTGKAA